MPKRVPTFRSGPSKQAVTRMYERARPRQADKNFYSSKPWLAIRREKLSIDPLCEVCLKDVRYVPATDVHHKLERKDRPDLALDLDNLESLCKACHGAKRRGQKR
jgi:5-methylcytosine-specific restriction protein A